MIQIQFSKHTSGVCVIQIQFSKHTSGVCVIQIQFSKDRIMKRVFNRKKTVSSDKETHSVEEIECYIRYFY